jgi:hypothetical protein
MRFKKITWQESYPRATRHRDDAFALKITVRSKTQRVFTTLKLITTPQHHDSHQSQKITTHHHHVGKAVEEKSHQDHGVSMIVVTDNYHL